MASSDADVPVPWDMIFDHFGVKKVTRTDRKKKAYVLNQDQLFAIEAAGIEPSEVRPAEPFRLPIMLDPETQSVIASFYLSERSEEAGRDPEPRLGREFISSWAETGDVVVIGSIGSRLFAAKTSKAAPDLVGQMLAKAGRAKRKDILALAGQAKGQPKRVKRTQSDFVRNQYVVAGALIRAKGRCELPGCKTVLFSKDDGQPFLEVHHVVPLAEGGVDELGNAAALCPMCHRELHFGRDRLKKREILATAIATKPV